MAASPSPGTHSDGYHGRVTPGGPPQVRELSHLTITKVAVNPEMSNNCYLLLCPQTGAKVLVDAAGERPRLLELTGTDVESVVTTHRHWDHHGALAEVVAATAAQTIAGTPDAASITEQTGVRIDREVGDGDVVLVGDQRLTVIWVVGHTPGSICLLYDDPDGHHHLFTGDSLFPGGVGNTRGDTEAFAQLVHDVEHKIFDRLPDDTWFYPGHGDDSTLGVERPHLAEWRARGW